MGGFFCLNAKQESGTKTGTTNVSKKGFDRDKTVESVWTYDVIYGAIIIGLIAQMFTSLM